LDKKKQYGCISRLLVIANIFAAILLIIASLVRYIPPDKWAIPAFLGLPYLYFMYLNIAFIFLWLFFRIKYSLISLSVLFLFSGLVQKHLQIFGTCSTDNEESLSILTYNAKYLTNQKDVFHFVEENNPDILFMQEFLTEDKGQSSLLEKLSNDSGLPRYHYQKYYSSLYGQKATAMVTFTHYPILARQSIEDNQRRIGMYTDIIIGKDTVRAFNVHLQSIHFQDSDIKLVNEITTNHLNTIDENSKYNLKRMAQKLKSAFKKRAGQARIIKEQIQSSPYPVIVCGDFNDTPASYTYKQIADLLEDSFCESGHGCGKTFNGLLPSLRIDYILHSDLWRSVCHEEHKINVSDHYPVSARLIRNE